VNANAVSLTGQVVTPIPPGEDGSASFRASGIWDAETRVYRRACDAAIVLSLGVYHSARGESPGAKKRLPRTIVLD
jgi:hypothetical protein